MAWFDDLSLPGFTVEGRFGWVTADGGDEDSAPDLLLARGDVTFTATAPAVRVDGAWVGIRPVQAVIYEGGIVLDESGHPVRLLSTDADTGVEGWGWVAKINVQGAKIPDIRFLGPTGATVNITGTDLAPITGNPVELITGPPGLSAYEVAVDNGYSGDQASWLDSLRGDGSAWSELTGVPDTFPPAAHTHVVNDVSGLASRLSALEGDTGWIDITSRVPVALQSGKVWICRTGKTVWLDFDQTLAAAAPSSSWHSWSSLIPTGYRPPRNYSYVPLSPQFNVAEGESVTFGSQARGPVRLSSSGSVVVYGAKTFGGILTPIQGLVSWRTDESFPA